MSTYLGCKYCHYELTDQGFVVVDACGYHVTHPPLPRITASNLEIAIWTGLLMVGGLTLLGLVGWGGWSAWRWLAAWIGA